MFDSVSNPRYITQQAPSPQNGRRVIVRFTCLFFTILAALLFIHSVSAQTLHIDRYTTREGLAGDVITALAFDSRGNVSSRGVRLNANTLTKANSGLGRDDTLGVWVGTSEGATHITNDEWISYTRGHGLGDSWITAIAIAPDHRVWFGTQSGGVSVFDPGEKTFTAYTLDDSEIPSNFITALAIDGQDRIWVGTLQNGVARFDPTAKSWTRYELPTPQITALAVDGSGTLWAGTATGVFSFDGQTWTRNTRVGTVEIRRIGWENQQLTLSTRDERFVLQNGEWVGDDGQGAIERAAQEGGLANGQITAIGTDEQARTWFGTARGIIVLSNGNAPALPKPLPVVLVHGWTVSDRDTLEASEFNFLKAYGDRDGIPMYYARGISPKNTLYQNAEVLRDEIARVKKETGAPRVNVIAFSMGGMNTRAYLESSLYAKDVNRAIILGTPQAGVETWKPILIQQILSKHDEPSAIELSPEYAELVRLTRTPNPNIIYDLLIGDAREQGDLDFLKNMPAGDALISVASALALDAPNVNKQVNADLHDWSPQPVPVELTSYLYPRDTYERYLRNALRNPGNAPIGSEVQPSPPAPLPAGEGRSHTPVVTASVRAGETVTRTVMIDDNAAARFIAYFPGGHVDFSVIAPNGTRYEPGDLPRTDQPGVLTLQTDLASFSGYNIENAQTGTWKLELTRTDGGREPLDVTTYADLDAPRRIEALTLGTVANASPPQKTRIELNAPPESTEVKARIAVPAREPAGAFTFVELPLYDDGQHDDRVQHDGYFANSFLPPYGGWYLIQFQARGNAWERETELLWAVNPNSGSLAPDADVKIENGQVTFDLGVDARRAGNFAVSAWLMGAAGEQKLQQVTPVTLKEGMNRIPISFDAATITPGRHSLELILLDANWAALWTDERQFQVSVPQH